MNGSFTKFEGSLALDPTDVTQSSVKLELDLTSVQLTPDQIIQSIFVQTALAHLRQQKTSFVSETIQRVKGQSFLITGMYTWQGKSKRTTVPVEIVRASPTLSEIRLLLNGKAKDGDSPPELSQLGGLSANGSKGWAEGTFVFTNNK
jgi:polyisoprenoid-binding protein YceI